MTIMRTSKIEDIDLIEKYKETKSVWKTGEFFGISGQSAHARLKKLNVKIDGTGDKWTNDHDLKLIEFYNTGFERGDGKLDQFCIDMKRTKSFISRKARSLGISNSNRTICDDKRQKTSIMMKKHIKENGHPKGSLGLKHTKETKEKISKSSIDCWAKMSDDRKALKTDRMLKSKSENGTLHPHRNGVTWKGGWREIGGQRKYFRSKWEANYARYLQWLVDNGNIKSWQHEPDTFWFLNIKRGVRSYLPDFKVTELNGSIVYHEVKGWMDDRSATKLKRMKKYHPEVSIILIDAKAYKSIKNSMSRIVSGWES